jgi:hypothetical protein
MAFPVVESTASGNSGANSLTHAITLPSGIAAGDLILVFFNNDGLQTASVTTPASGWNGPVGQDVTASNRLSMFWRWADGTEGATITITVTSTEAAAWTVYRISGADDTCDPEISAGATGTSVTPDPDSLTTSWGSRETLWLAVYGWDGNVAHSSYPTDYADNRLTNRWADTVGVGIASATAYGITETDDPSAGALASSEEWVAYTVAVKPAIVALSIYRTVLDADSYFGSQLYADDWTGASESDKEKALLAATRAVDSLKFRGYKKTVYDLLEADPDATDEEIQDAYDSQVLQFPRDTQDADTVPDDVFWAVCEEAMTLLSGKRPDQEFNNLPMNSDGVGSFRASADRSQMPPKHTAHFITSPTAWKYLQRWLDPLVNTFNVRRV